MGRGFTAFRRAILSRGRIKRGSVKDSKGKKGEKTHVARRTANEELFEDITSVMCQRWGIGS